MEKKVEKISFFRKMWYSITKFELYPDMAIDGLKNAIKYLVILSLIISAFMIICELHEMKTIISYMSNYVQENLPEFNYSNGIISMDSQETIAILDIEKLGIDQILINTTIETENEKEQLKNENEKEGISIFLFKDQVIMKARIEGYENIEQKYTYQDIIANFTRENVEKFNKKDFIQYLSSKDMISFYSTYAVSTFIYYFIENVIVVLIYSLEIALLGWITTIILRIKMKFKALYSMAAYSITLPSILMTIYIIINYFTEFTIKDFQIAYIAISYIYLAAAIFILKDDFIQKMQEVQKIRIEQQKVKKEIEEQEENNKDKEEKEEKEEKEDDEPQGSQA